MNTPQFRAAGDVPPTLWVAKCRLPQPVLILLYPYYRKIGLIPKSEYKIWGSPLLIRLRAIKSLLNPFPLAQARAFRRRLKMFKLLLLLLSVEVKLVNILF